MKNPYIEYFNELQARLEAISRPHNEALAFTKKIRDMHAHAIDFSGLTRTHREAMEQLQRNLSLIHTLRYTRTIEDEEECTTPGEDIRLLFGDIY